MPQATPTILALDFDGVVCDGLIEYFQTAWKAYCRIWKPTDLTPPAGLAEPFYRARPVVESGWEMPLVLRSLQQGTPEDDILSHWPTLCKDLVQQEGIVPAELAATVDAVRDEWIATDGEHWLAQHRFYPGVVDRLQYTLSSPVQVRIITTKEGRFVRQLLQQQGVEMADRQILGKEVKQPKAQTLRDLFAEFGSDSVIWFVEDRLKTLQGIQTQPDLSSVGLFLATWGYNTADERNLVKQGKVEQGDRIHPLSLEQFAQEFPAWVADK